MWSASACSAAAGLLGALSACSAKLALGADHLRDLCEDVVGEQGGVCEWIHLLLRLCCICLVFLCNAVMWTFFAKALRLSSSSATATVTTTASNFVSSAFLGKVLFGESRALLWWVGISITLCGLLLLHKQTPPSKDESETKKES
ncbi:transmembrane protein 42 [Spea bombifrons]|uniref:transmembrane protein 42 n=1 Tax=Spea bombifrons TaxID=233779 RepID=UPI00234B8EBE|nr:transmembrane protein 42 [Spea bombifrons]